MPLLVHHKTPIIEHFPARDPFFTLHFGALQKDLNWKFGSHFFCYIRAGDEGDKILNKQIQYGTLRYYIITETLSTFQTSKLQTLISKNVMHFLTQKKYTLQ